MILSDRDIRAKIATGQIQIDPFSEDRMKPGSYVLSLGNTFFKPQSRTEVDARHPQLDYAQERIPDEGFVLKPGEFVLGQTLERVSISQELAAAADVPTTLARIGLQTVLSSTYIEPGQRQSQETLEIKNLSQQPIRVFPGMKIIKIIFYELKTPASFSYGDVGDYAGQHDPRPK